MPQLTPDEIAALAARAGFTGQDLEMAVTIALAESDGWTDRLGDLNLQNATYGPSVGLWQIRTVHPGPNQGWFDRLHHNHQDNLDPQTNANNAHAIFQRYGWRRWGSYTDGRYRQFLEQGRTAAQRLQQQQQQQQQQQAPQDPQRRGDAGGGGGGGMQFPLADLLGAVSKLLNPSNQLGRAAQTARGAAASSAAFGNVESSASVAARHQRNTAEYGDATEAARNRLDRIKDEIRGSEQSIREFDQNGSQRINRTVVDPMTFVG
ncbi:MAG TPA: hypothetical protein VFV67_32185 [Actinophytocola sp.]|uniref:hypothetical protein n=1 Tax=Actinophytocola sp. TaxID=1872138 RepID=UPI002DBD5655|nr:hypothetical protein [Actinophytocola sp.]HEU5475326.1 hypothetical protein [Actinophytocola sp.]